MLSLYCNTVLPRRFIHLSKILSLCYMKLLFSYIWENETFSVFITPTRVLGQMSAVHRVNKKNQVGALHTDSQHSQPRICIECKYWQHMALWKIHWSGKLLCFPHTHYPSNWTSKPVMKKVCACAFHERLHMCRRCISPQTTEPDTWRTWWGIYVRTRARQGLILTII